MRNAGQKSLAQEAGYFRKYVRYFISANHCARILQKPLKEKYRNRDE